METAACLLQADYLTVPARCANMLLGQATGPPGWAAFLPMAFLAVLFYIMLVRPERRRKEEHKKLVSHLKKHDRVVTIGGVYGMVANASQGSPDITLLVDENSNTKIRVQRSAIARVITENEPAEVEK
jgi:preprotein translocase subunit YajC